MKAKYQAEWVESSVFSHERTLTGNGPVKQQFQSRQHIPGLWALKEGKSLRQALRSPISVWRHLADSSTRRGNTGNAFPQAGSCRAVEIRIRVQGGWDTCSLQSRASERKQLRRKRGPELCRGAHVHLRLQTNLCIHRVKFHGPGKESAGKEQWPRTCELNN